MKKIIRIVLLVVVIGVAAVFGYRYYESRQANSENVYTKLENASDLITQKLTYRNVFKDSSGSIPFINKDEFLVAYTATISAGIDVKKINVETTTNEIKVTIPQAEIKEVNVDPNDIKFYSTSLTVFRSGKDAAVASAKKAKADAEKNAKSDKKFLSAANDNSKTLIKGLLKDVAGSREIKVEIKSN